MNFFEQQDKARRKTKLLVLYFAFAVAGIVLGLYGAMLLILTHADMPGGSWGLFGIVAAVTVAVIGLGAIYKIAQLSSGGSAVAQMLGGRLISAERATPEERRLLNVVEEMAIASGTPVPDVYVLDDEAGINAFAAGFTPRDAVIGVTRGTIQTLNRDELQGVVGHEFSHILNGDMRLNLRLIGLLHGILLIALIGYWVLRSVGGRSRVRRSSREKGGGGAAILAIGVAMLVIGGIGVFFGKLIKSAVSRQREYLADASAVQFTRNPGGLAGALKKIGGMIYGSQIHHPNAEQASHLFFGSSFSSWFDAFATHPPIKDRIQRIDPSFDGTFPKVASMEADVSAAEAIAMAEQMFPTSSKAIPQAAAMAVASNAVPAWADRKTSIRKARFEAKVELRSDSVAGRMGAPTAQHVAYAVNLVASLPDELRAAARETFGARAVIYGLLLNREPDIRARQLERIRTFGEDGVYRELEKLMSAIESLGPEARMPMLDLAIPALRRLSNRQHETFRKNVTELVNADARMDLFEYVLQRALGRRLDPHFSKAAPPPVQYYALKPLAEESAAMLSMLAYAGSSDDSVAMEAFRRAAARLQAPNLMLAPIPRAAAGFDRLDAALDVFASASPLIKKKILEACVECVTADGQVTVSEAELLRAVSDALDCPMPPVGALAASA